MNRIVKVLMQRDGMMEDEAELLFSDAKKDFNERLTSGESFMELEDFCNEWFGLEPDYLDELIY